MFQTKAVEKIKTHILCSITFFNLSVYHIIQKNTVRRTGHSWQYGASVLGAGYLSIIVCI